MSAGFEIIIREIYLFHLANGKYYSCFVKPILSLCLFLFYTQKEITSQID